MRWEYADLMRISRQSHSVVSQWLGRGSKEIKSIGKLEAAIYIERESGYSALWVAKGMGPKRVAQATGGRTPALAVREPPAAYSPDDTLERMGMLLAAVPAETRGAVADILRGWALEGGADSRRNYLLALLRPIEKQQA